MDKKRSVKCEGIKKVYFKIGRTSALGGKG